MTARLAIRPVGLLIAVVVLVFLIPARVIVPGLTSIGRPGTLLAIGLLLLWTLSRLHPRLVSRGRQPMRWALLVYATALTISYAVGELRGLSEAESNSADRTMLALAAMAGVTVVAADGLRHRDQLNMLLRVAFWSGVAMSLVGIVQFVSREDITIYFLPPGLVFQAPPVGLAPRGAAGLVRVAGTAGHYIEFSVLVAAIVVPLGLHFSRFAARASERQLVAIATVISACAIPLALSRTGIIALCLVLIVIGAAWTWQRRIVIALVTVTTTVVFGAIQPGLIDTLCALFTNAVNDPSISGRTEDYALVFPLINERPWLGRGTGTFVPGLYPLLDNQWLLTLVSSGIIGVLGLLVLFGTGIWLSGAVWLRAAEESDRHLAACLVAGLVAFAFAAATFDVLFFTTFVVTFGILLGAAGALWHVSGSGRSHVGH